MNQPPTRESFLREAIRLAREGMRQNAGGPFGAIVVREREIIGRGWNRVTSTNDPTAHAEIVAIRDACQRLGSFRLSGCDLYASCEPCPMCLGAIYWARLDRIFHAATRNDAAGAGFDDAHLYSEIARPPKDRELPAEILLHAEGKAAFQEWRLKHDRVGY